MILLWMLADVNPLELYPTVRVGHLLRQKYQLIHKLISEFFLDSVIHPDLRDRMIVYQGATTVHVIYLLLSFS